MGASIFMASIVATVWPASTSSPTPTVRVTAPAKGAATCAGLSGCARSPRADGVLHGPVPDRHHAGLAVEPAEHGPETALVRLPDGVDRQVQRKAGVQGDLDFVPGRQAVEKGGGG